MPGRRVSPGARAILGFGLTLGSALSESELAGRVGDHAAGLRATGGTTGNVES